MMDSGAQFVLNGLQHFSSTIASLDLSPECLSDAVDILASATSPIICSGVGKSGFIAAKMVATLNSLAIRASYLNPVDALHGDMGFIEDGSVVILISNSGSTSELLDLVPSLQARNCQILSLVSNKDSALAKVAKVPIAYGKVQEVDENGLAPTTSTVVQMALTDVLSAAVSRKRGLSPKGFYRNHPAGALGKRLMKAEALMRAGDDMPIVARDSSVIDVLSVITRKRIGCTCVIDANGRLVGLITDGDIRRALAERLDIYNSVAGDIMQPNPQTARMEDYVEKLMQKNEYLGRHFTIPVVDDERMLKGVLVSIDLI